MPMLHVEFKRSPCRRVKFKKRPCRAVDFTGPPPLDTCAAVSYYLQDVILILILAHDMCDEGLVSVDSVMYRYYLQDTFSQFT